MKNDSINFRCNSNVKNFLIAAAKAENLTIGDYIIYKLYTPGEFCPKCKTLLGISKFKKGTKIVCDNCKHEFKI